MKIRELIRRVRAHVGYMVIIWNIDGGDLVLQDTDGTVCVTLNIKRECYWHTTLPGKVYYV